MSMPFDSWKATWRRKSVRVCDNDLNHSSSLVGKFFSFDRMHSKKTY
jgi:hypothetical protein